MGMYKIIGDLFGGYVVHVAGAIGAYIVASEAASVFTNAMTPITNALN